MSRSARVAVFKLEFEREPVFRWPATAPPRMANRAL